MARKLIVEIVGDASSLERSFKQAEKSTKGFGNTLEGAGRGAVTASVGFRGLGRSVAFASGAFLGGAGLAAVLKGSVDAASNLSEQIAKTDVVFGDSAKAVEDWSKTSASALGLARDQALEVASSFGALFQPLKIVGEQSAQQSEQLTQLGADLASFYNTDVADALAAIKSGLVGEAEPLRRYGILLSETRVQQEALTESGKRSARDLTAREKVLARIALIYKDSSQAQGDVARSQDRLAQQSKELRARLRDLETEIGQGLIPGLTEAVRWSNKLIAAWERIPGHGFTGVDAIKALAKNAGDIARHAPVIGGLFRTIAGEKPDPGWTPFLQSIASLIQQGNLSQKMRAVESGITSLSAGSLIPPRVKGSFMVGRDLTPREQLNLLLSGDPDNVGALRGLIGLDRKALAFAMKQLNSGSGNTKAFLEAANRLRGEISDFTARIASIAEANALKAKAAAEKAAAAQKKYMEHLRSLFEHTVATVNLSPASISAAVRQNLRTLAERNKKLADQFKVVGGRVTDAQRSAAQFVALGLTRTGEEHGPTIKGLRRRARNLLRRAKTPAMQAELVRIIHVLNGDAGTPTPQVLSKIRDMLDDVAQTLGASTADRVPVVAAPNLRRLAAGLGLSPSQVGQLRSNFNALDLASPVKRSLQSASTTIAKMLPRVVADAFTQYPALGRYAGMFAFKQSGPSPLGYQSESYGKGERGSFDPSKLAIELFGSKNRPMDIAGEIVSHFLARGIDPTLTKLYEMFAKSLTPAQMKWLRRDYKREGDDRSFEAYMKASGIPALFRGKLFNQLDKYDVTYTPAQIRVFKQVLDYLSGVPVRGLSVVRAGGRTATVDSSISASFSIPVEVDGRQVALATHRHVVKAEQRKATQTRGRQTR